MVKVLHYREWQLCRPSGRSWHEQNIHGNKTNHRLFCYSLWLIRANKRESQCLEAWETLNIDFFVATLPAPRAGGYGRPGRFGGPELLSFWLLGAQYRGGIGPLCSMGQYDQESKRKYWAICSSVCSLAHSLTPELVGKCMNRCLKTTWLCPTVHWYRSAFWF